jgi:hypothetical protein
MSPLERRRRDLRLWRLVLGLALAPAPAGGLVLAAEGAIRRPPLVHFLWEARVVFESSVLWSLIAGFAYLAAVTLWRRRISRAECLALGAVSAVLFPPAVLAYRHFAPPALLALLALKPHTDPFSAEFPDWRDLADWVALALCASFGFLGGWIFWGVGIRPAPLPPPEISAFD